jgi:hypothetical protein
MSAQDNDYILFLLPAAKKNLCMAFLKPHIGVLSEK